jgi:hypothetical protein
MNEHRIQLNLATTAVIVGLGFAVSLVTSTAVVARAYQRRGDQAARHEQTMCVKGSTRRRIHSDRAVWRITVRAENRELKEAYATLDEGVRKVLVFLEKKGFTPAEYNPGAITTTAHYERDAKGNETRKIIEYTLNRDIGVWTSDVDRVGRTAGEVTELIQDGVLVMSDHPEYYYTGLAKLKLELMGEASKDARARAEEIARNAGGRVADVRSAHMGVLQITQPLSTETSSEGVYDTSTIEKDVQAVVTVTFRIESG